MKPLTSIQRRWAAPTEAALPWACPPCGNIGSSPVAAVRHPPEKDRVKKQPKPDYFYQKRHRRLFSCARPAAQFSRSEKVPLGSQFPPHTKKPDPRAWGLLRVGLLTDGREASHPPSNAVEGQQSGLSRSGFAFFRTSHISSELCPRFACCAMIPAGQCSSLTCAPDFGE